MSARDLTFWLLSWHLTTLLMLMNQVWPSSLLAILSEIADPLRTWQNLFYFGIRYKQPAEKEGVRPIRVRFHDLIPSLNLDRRKLLGYGSAGLLGSNSIDQCHEGSCVHFRSYILIPSYCEEEVQILNMSGFTF